MNRICWVFAGGCDSCAVRREHVNFRRPFGSAFSFVPRPHSSQDSRTDVGHLFSWVPPFVANLPQALSEPDGFSCSGSPVYYSVSHRAGETPPEPSVRSQPCSQRKRTSSSLLPTADPALLPLSTDAPVPVLQRDGIPLGSPCCIRVISRATPKTDSHLFAVF